jgi:predicted CoA-binding protein
MKLNAGANRTLHLGEKMADRLNTQLEADGAEHLVLGHLLIQGMECFKAVTNQPGYDIIAINPLTQKAAKIQVKSRWATNRAGKSLSFRKMDFDFLVHVGLNRGERRKGVTDTSFLRDPDYHIIPVEIVKSVLTPSGKVTMSKIPDINQYKDKWIQISNFIS